MREVGADPEALVTLARALERAATDLRVARRSIEADLALAGEPPPPALVVR